MQDLTTIRNLLVLVNYYILVICVGQGGVAWHEPHVHIKEIHVAGLQRGLLALQLSLLSFLQLDSLRHVALIGPVAWVHNFLCLQVVRGGPQ